MLKGVLALALRYLLYALGGALVGAGVAAQTIDGSQLCVDVKAAADLASNAVLMIAGGSVTFGASFLWSRAAKAVGGVT